MRLRVIVFALVATAVAVGLVLPSADAGPPKPPKPVKPGQSFSMACPSGYTALGGTVEWYDKKNQLLGTSPGTVVGTSTVMFGPAPKDTVTAVVTELNCQAPTTTTIPPTTTTTTTTTLPPTTTTTTTTTLPPDPNVYLTGTAPVPDQGLILYGVGIFTGLPIPGGDPNIVRDCPDGYVMDFEQSTFTETGGTDILTPELITDYGPVIIINNSTLYEGEPTTATLEYSIACVPV
jgi:hypothetical protein